MILGADNQNKNLRLASNIKVDGKRKTRTANHYSAAISTSKTSEFSSSARTQRTTAHESRSNINDGRPDPLRGSMEGLDNGKSTHIQQNNRGYDAKALQSARYASRDKAIEPQRGSSFLFTNKQKNGIMNNYSNITMAGSSSDRLNKQLNLNRYI
jgi:hypothetical protein